MFGPLAFPVSSHCVFSVLILTHLSPAAGFLVMLLGARCLLLLCKSGVVGGPLYFTELPGRIQPTVHIKNKIKWVNAGR